MLYNATLQLVNPKLGLQHHLLAHTLRAPYLMMKKNYAKTKHKFSVILRAESHPQQQFDKLVHFHIGFAFADWQILDENNIIYIIKNKAEEALIK